MPHIRQRDGVFQYERRVPAHVQRDALRFDRFFKSRPLFRCSLKTKDLTQASLAYATVNRRFEEWVAPPTMNLAIMDTPSAATAQRIVTNTDLEAIADRYRDLTAASFERLHRLAGVDPDAADELERQEYEFELNAEDIRRALQPRASERPSPIQTPLEEASWVVRDSGFIAPPGSQELGAIASAIRIGKQRGYERIMALGEGYVLPTIPDEKAPKSKPCFLTLSEAVDRYLAARQPSSKVASETRLALRQFEESVGRKALAAISRQDMHRFVEHLASQQVGGKTKGSVSRHLSEGSIVKRLRMLISVIEKARDDGDFAGENPARGIKVSKFIRAEDKAVMPAKRRLSVDELNLVFAHPWFVGCKSPTEKHLPGDLLLEGAEFWAPIVAAFTGCRAGELGGIKLSEVRTEDRLPHFIIRPNEYRGVKNGRSRRVPMLDVLFDLGFATYVERVAATGADRLFPDWTAQKRRGGGPGEYPAWSNAALVRAFNRTVIPGALGDILSAEMRREVTFHSMRGAFKAMLTMTNKVPVYIANAIIAHADNDLDQRYIGELTIEETYPEVHQCSYAGIVLPPARV